MTRGSPELTALDRTRRAVHAFADVLAFLVESACVGNGVFWFLTWGALSFDWRLTARAYAGFWTHYVAAGPSARHPVELTVLAILAALTTGVAAIRAPRVSLGRTSATARRDKPATTMGEDTP